MQRPAMLLIRTVVVSLCLSSIALAAPKQPKKANRTVAQSESAGLTPGQRSLDQLSRHSESEVKKMLELCSQQKMNLLLSSWNQLETYLADEISALAAAEKAKVADQEALYQALEFLMPHLIPEEVPMGEVPARCLDSITEVKMALQSTPVSSKNYRNKVEDLSGCWHEQYRLEFPAFAERWIECFKKLK